MSLPTYTPEQIPAHINECLLFNEFRPTAVAFVVSDDALSPRLVLVKSAREEDDVWWPPQGGLDGRTPELTVAEELKEEIDLEVCPDRVRIIEGMDYQTRLRDGFTAGKFLIACAVEYNSFTARMKPNETEISDLKTVTVEGFNRTMAWNKVNRPETARKADFYSIVANSL
jgi:ADP-ribose pyrophosphatase YjhB (NUDIX family)